MILLTGAWRLFFPAAGLFAGLALPLWLLLYAGRADLMVDPMAWHMHEMLFGYLPAALAGFLLTAIPNWTGRPALTGAPLGALFALWLAGRVAMFVAADHILAALMTGAFLWVLGAVAGREIVKSGNKRNLVVVAIIFALALTQAVFLAGFEDTGINGGFATALVMMVLIGGRVTPAFSRNWLMKRGSPALPPPFGLVDKAAIGASVATGLVWTVSGTSLVTGIVALIATAAIATRMVRWQGWAVRSEPLLLGQHAAYLWLAIATALLALTSLSDWATLSQTRHAMGAGAAASMTVIVMMRAALGHSGRALAGNKWDWVLLTALHLGAGLRVGSGWMDNPTLILNIAGLMWAAAFLLFALRTIPIALAPRQ